MTLIRLMRETPFTGTRQTNNGKYSSDGFPKKPVFDDISGTGNFQPLSDKELLQLEEGDRLRESFNLFTETPLTENDIIIRNNVEYEVRGVQDWFQQRIAHNMAVIVRKDV